MIKLTDRLSVTADKYQYIVGTPRQITPKSGGAPVTKLDNPRGIARPLRRLCALL